MQDGQQNYQDDQFNREKVEEIAQKIRELTEKTTDPVERERALNEWKVKFNNQIISLKEFLALVNGVEEMQQESSQEQLDENYIEMENQDEEELDEVEDYEQEPYVM